MGEEQGPIYGVELIDSLPLGGMMHQAMPSRADLQRVLEVSQRTVAGYEVLLEHWRKAILHLAAAETERDAAMQQLARLSEVQDARDAAVYLRIVLTNMTQDEQMDRVYAKWPWLKPEDSDES